MVDLFGFTDAGALNNRDRQIASDISNAFDNAREMEERTRSRYSIPQIAGFESDLALERARSLADALNKSRLQQARIDSDDAFRDKQFAFVQQQYADNLGFRNQQVQDQRRGARNAGLMQLGGALLGRDNIQQLLMRGIIPGIGSLFGGQDSAPNEGVWNGNVYTSPTGQIYTEGGGVQDYGPQYQEAVPDYSPEYQEAPIMFEDPAIDYGLYY